MIKKFTVIIPVYNEASVLESTIMALLRFTESSSIRAELLFVDDGSKDESTTIIRSFMGTHPGIELIQLDTNYGLSTALKAGINHAQTEWIGYIDADLQTNPQDFEHMFPFMNAFDLITGSRIRRKDGFIKRLSSRFANWFRQLVTKDGVNDTGCPLKLMKRSYAENLLLYRGMHRFIPALFQLQGGRVKQIEVRHYPRTAGRSKFNVFNRSLGPLIDCFVFLWMRRRYIKYRLQ